MRHSLYIYLLLGTFLLSSCEGWWGRDTFDDRELIYLSASLPVPDTKAPYMEASGSPTEENPLNVAVWASTTLGEFKDLGKTGVKESETGEDIVAVHTTAYFQSGDAQLLSAAIYPPPTDSEQNPKPVYFVSMHPHEGWSTNKDQSQQDIGTEAHFTFDGSQDAMFAKQVEGKYRELKDDTKYPTLSYNHLLTLFNVSIGMDPEDVKNGETLLNIQNAWGTLQELKIQRRDVDVTDQEYGEHVESLVIDLTKGGSFDYSKDVSFVKDNDRSKYLHFKGINTNTDFVSESSPYTLTEEVNEVAYVICAPTEAQAGSEGARKSEYIITIKTEKRGLQTISLDIKDSNGNFYDGSTMGKQFKLTLYFKRGKNISLESEFSDWYTGGYGVGNIYD